MSVRVVETDCGCGRYLGNMSKLSVIIPIYNKKEYLRSCILSVLNQSFPDIEVILVDDGSTDGCKSICDEIASTDRRVKVIHQKNMGPVIARLVGVRTASAKYVTFVDGDDYVDNDSYIYVDQYIKSDIDIICFEMKNIFDNSESVIVKNDYAQGLYDRERLEEEIYNNMIWDEGKKRCGLNPSLCSKIFKRDFLLPIYEKFRDIQLCVCDDVLVSFNCMYRAESVQFVDMGFYNYRKRIRGEVEPYFLDKNYLEKIALFYKYMKCEFDHSDVMMRQLELYYASLVAIVKRKYDVSEMECHYIFPFHRVEKGSSVIIYGAGKVGKLIHSQVANIPYCNIVAWVDKDVCNRIVKPVDSINNLEFDVIVIAIADMNIVSNVKEELLRRGIEESKILVVNSVVLS